MKHGHWCFSEPNNIVVFILLKNNPKRATQTPNKSKGENLSYFMQKQFIVNSNRLDFYL